MKRIGLSAATVVAITALVLGALLIGWWSVQRVRERFEDATDADAAFKERMKLLEAERDQAITGTAGAAGTETADNTPSDVYSFVAGYCQ